MNMCREAEVSMSGLVTIFGGSGFVGRYIARRLARDGWRVRVAVRRPNEALHVRPYGAVGQVEPVFCNIRDDDCVRVAMSGATAAVNCVGTFDRSGRNNFSAVQHLGAERIAHIAADEGIERLVHVSAIGADRESDSLYAQTKARGEEGVIGNFPRAVILRPSVIFGPEDGFFNRFASMARMGPVLPLVGANTRFQPVYVDDVARVAVMGVTGDAVPGIYELGGPEVLTLRESVVRMLDVIHRRRLVLSLPFFVGNIIATVFDGISGVTLGLISNRMLTRDQLRSLRHDNTASGDAAGFADLGIEPTPVGAIMPEYLWRYRPRGQYDAIARSAGYLRDRG